MCPASTRDPKYRLHGKGSIHSSLMRELKLHPGTLPGYSTRLHLDHVNHAYAPAEVPPSASCLNKSRHGSLWNVMSLFEWLPQQCCICWNPYTEAVFQQLPFWVGFPFQHLEILVAWTGMTCLLKIILFSYLGKHPQDSLHIQFKTFKYTNNDAYGQIKSLR